MLFRSDRKSTRLNSSHTLISYAVFCLKKKKKNSMIEELRPARIQPRLREHISLRTSPHPLLLCAPSSFRILMVFSLSCVFFFKGRGPPRAPPFSPPRPFPY